MKRIIAATIAAAALTVGGFAAVEASPAQGAGLHVNPPKPDKTITGWLVTGAGW